MTRRSMASAILVAVVFTVLLAGLVALAQQDQNTNSNMNRNGNMNSTRSGQNQNMNASMTLDSSDKKFMMEAGMGGMAEVQWAQLALQRASSDAVKQYAQRMVDDHTKANETLTQLASTKGITLPTALDDKHASLLAKLQRLSGAEFDRTYVKEAGVKAHGNMEKLFMREADRGKDADAKAFASSTLPTVQEHLRMARDMAGGMSGNKNMSTSGSNANTSGNSNMSRNDNTGGGNMNTPGDRNMNDNTSGANENDNMSGNSNTMNSNGNSNTMNANGNSNNPG